MDQRAASSDTERYRDWVLFLILDASKDISNCCKRGYSSHSGRALSFVAEVLQELDNLRGLCQVDAMGGSD